MAATTQAVGIPPLTLRETEILTLVGEGLTNRQIGRTLVISAHTVKTFLRLLARKLGTGDRAGMVGVALHAGILRPRPLPAGVLVPAVRPEHATVVRLVAHGLSNGQIAARTGVSVCTVQGRVKWWLVGFGARNRAHAVRLAADAGVLAPSSLRVPEPQNGPESLAGVVGASGATDGLEGDPVAARLPARGAPAGPVRTTRGSHGPVEALGAPRTRNPSRGHRRLATGAIAARPDAPKPHTDSEES